MTKITHMRDRRPSRTRTNGSTFTPLSEAAPALAANGYRPVPVITGAKRPALSDWPSYEFSPRDADQYAGCSTGILCGGASGISPVDIDVRDAKVEQEIEKKVVELLGPTVRRVGLAPKAALLVVQKSRSQNPRFGVSAKSCTDMPTAAYAAVVSSKVQVRFFC